MMLATHVMVGATLAVALAPDRPWLAFLLGFFSHLLIDVIPHGDVDLYVKYEQGKQVRLALAYNIIDALVTIVFIAVLLEMPVGEHLPMAVAFGVIGGVLPDVLAGLLRLRRYPWLEAFNKIHFFFHDGIAKCWDVPLWFGITMQIIAIGLLFPRFL